MVVKYPHNKVEWFVPTLTVTSVRSIFNGGFSVLYYVILHGWGMFHPCFDFIIKHLEVLEHRYERNSDQ